MRGINVKIWVSILVGALLLVMIGALAGCVATQTTRKTDQQPPAQTQTGPTEPGLPEATESTEPAETEAEKALPILQNATFEMDHYAWSAQGGKIVTEQNGNKCMEVGYTWGLYQFLQVKPGESYQIYGRVRQGSAPATPARMNIIFYDSEHKIMAESVEYLHNPGPEWGSLPKKVFTVPKEALFTKLFLLSNGKGTVCYDNISVSLVQKEGSPAPGAAQ